MKLVKLADTIRHINHNGTVSVLIDKELILKISPADIFAIGTEQLKRLLPDDKVSIGLNFIEHVFSVMEISPKVIETIQKSLKEKDPEKDLTDVNVDDNLPPTEDIESTIDLTEKEKDWLDFVQLFVNEGNPVNRFPLAEIKQVLLENEIDVFINFLDSNGYKTELFLDSVIISL